ncbi:MAG: LysM peptidoglycan-binding domain-containing protein [Myxococcota bacterium]|jgi:nucleoid-associated protein YgaU|nr:LysM peptidoglycan-binding domain-containing protein [Myxococcota bacterium]
MGESISGMGGKLSHSPRAWITLKPETGATVVAMINPKELEYSKTVGWAEQAGKSRDFPDLQFTAGKAITMSVELMFDKYEIEASVKPECESLLKMALVDEGLHRPPKVDVMWAGDIIPGGFKGVVESVKVRYTMFLPSGIPCRAVATVGLKQAAGECTSGNSPDIAKMRIVKRGETLQSIAESEYRSAKEWRRIADANKVDDPLTIEPGTKLLIPPIL